MIFRQRKTFLFSGTVTGSTGLLKKQIIGKPVLGIITVLGNKEDLDSPIHRVFKVGGKITQGPLMGLCPGNDFGGEDYPYVLRNLQINDMMSSQSGDANISLTVVPWKRLDDIVVCVMPKGWFMNRMVGGNVVKGTAELLSSEDLPDAIRKR